VFSSDENSPSLQSMAGAGAAYSHDALGNVLVYEKKKKKNDGQDHLPICISEFPSF